MFELLIYRCMLWHVDVEVGSQVQTGNRQHARTQIEEGTFHDGFIHCVHSSISYTVQQPTITIILCYRPKSASVLPNTENHSHTTILTIFCTIPAIL